jgi:hypothetical protein
MQIILTEEEYNALKKATNIEKAARDLASDMVQRWVKNAIPVVVGYGPDPYGRNDLLQRLSKIPLE